MSTPTSPVSPKNVAPSTPATEQTNWDFSALGRDTPAYLVPRMDHEAVSTPVFYRQLIMRDKDAFDAAIEGGTEINEAIDPFAPLTSLPQPNKPIEGAVISYEQGWYEKGLALGRLLHSTCLAPGEVTKIAITSFRRSSKGSSQEAATQDDSVGSETDQAAAVHETQRAVAHETQTGGSFHTGVSAQGQAGVSGGGLFVSGSASTALSTAMGVSTATSSGARDTAVSGARNLSQRTVATSHSVRGRRAMQVREASESEDQSATTRVLANYNHMHALTMMFFEVLQVYELETKPVHAERVLFLPMKEIVFDDAAIRANAGALQDIFATLGQTDQIEALNDFLASDIARLRQAENGFKNILEETLRSAGYNPDSYPGMQYPKYEGIPLLLDRIIDGTVSFLLELGDARTAADNANLEQSQKLHDDVKRDYDRFLERHATLRRAIRIGAYLESHSLRFSQYLWLMLDPARVQRLILHRSFKGEALDHLMDPRPLGVHGNYLAFRWPHATGDGDAKFVENYVGDDIEGPPIAKLVLPSGGVFGEAVLGQAVSAEKIDLTRFWNWKDSPIPILPPEMSPISLASRAQGMKFDPVTMEASLTELLKPSIPDGPKLSEMVAKIMGNFKDMSGQDQLGTMLAAQVAAAQSGAAKAGDLSLGTLKANQAFGEKLLDSDLVKAAFATAFPESEAATMLGGLIGATKTAPKNSPKGGSSKVGPTVTPPSAVIAAASKRNGTSIKPTGGSKKSSGKGRQRPTGGSGGGGGGGN